MTNLVGISLVLLSVNIVTNQEPKTVVDKEATQALHALGRTGAIAMKLERRAVTNWVFGMKEGTNQPIQLLTIQQVGD